MDSLIGIIAVYLIFINIIGFLLMFIDKKKAENNRYRIPEATLLGASFIGGGLGVYAGMQKFRHKTKKKKFTVGVPIAIVFNLIVFVWIFFTFVN